MAIKAICSRISAPKRRWRSETDSHAMNWCSGEGFVLQVVHYVQKRVAEESEYVASTGIWSIGCLALLIIPSGIHLLVRFSPFFLHFWLLTSLSPDLQLSSSKRLIRLQFMRVFLRLLTWTSHWVLTNVESCGCAYVWRRFDVGSSSTIFQDNLLEQYGGASRTNHGCGNSRYDQVVEPT